MGRKIPSLITGINIDRATFHNAPVEKLSFINFFYGNNGAGKSSIAYAIDEDEGVTWADGRSRDDYDVLVYNRDFVDENFSSYGDLKGVFIVNKVNKEVQVQIDAKTEEKKKLDEEFTSTQDEWHKKSDAQTTLLSSFQNECWDKTTDLRADFADALEGKKTKKGFAEAILGEANPTEHDPKELKRLCDVAFDTTSRAYPEFQRVGTKSTYGTLPGKDLLDKVIVSSAETDFAKFVRKIKASDWVLEGHKHYSQNDEKKCPFCQQKLPDTFEEDIKKCFDEQYQQDVSDVLTFQSTYDREMAAITQKLRSNLDDVMPSLDMMDDYKSKLELLESKVSINSGRLAVLDFVNTYEEIKDAFAPYFTTTLLSNSVTPTAIYDLEAKIDAYTVLDPDDIEKANELLYKKNISSKDKQKLTFYFKKSKNMIEAYELIKQAEIVALMRHFIRFYEFMLQVSCFEDVDLHKKYNFMTYLLAYINIKHPGGGFNLDGKIKATNFVQKKAEEHTKPDLVAKPVMKLPTAESFGLTEAKEERLSQIIAEINSRTGKAYDNDVAVKAMLQIKDILMKSDKLKTSAKNNTVKDFEFAYFDDIDDALIEGLSQNQDFFSLLLSNDEIKKQVLGIFTEEIYKSLRNA